VNYDTGHVAGSDDDARPNQLPLLQLTNGFMAFKTFAAAVELGVFTELAGGAALGVDAFAQRFGLGARPARVLTAGLASLGLLESGPDGYRNSRLAETFLVDGRPDYFGDYVRFYDQMLYPVWHRASDALRTGRPVLWDPDERESVFGPEDKLLMQLFWEAMHSLAGFTANALAGVYDFGAHRRLLDVGGGSGGFPIALCRTVPSLSASVYELPHVCPIAEGKIADAGLGDRVGTIAGDFSKDPHLPGGYDAILLSQILHCVDEPTGRALLDKGFAALEPGGSLLICEFLLNPERTGPPEAALMGMNMLIGQTGGQNYSETEYTAWLTEAGFEKVEIRRFASAGANGVVVGRKPGDAA
jgi:ubiquinone/menaquinone biosynthesis C-methylase UbiE